MDQLTSRLARGRVSAMSATLLKPRDYQVECLDALDAAWDKGLFRPASVLPTGAGKTVVFSHLAERHIARNPLQRVLFLSHTDELVGQAARKMAAVAPHRTVGIVKAGQNEIHAQVISASVQTLRSPARRAQIHGVGLVVVDEAHHAVAKTYRDILEHFGCLDGRTRAAGFTATMVRSDKEKLRDIWEEVVYKRDIAFMIRRGYLLDVRGRLVQVPDLNLSKVKQSGGDYQEGALGEALTEALAPEKVAQAYAEHAIDRKGILFAPTVASAEMFAEALNAEGISAEVVHGALARDTRRGILARLRSGETRVVCNCMVLTEGFDDETVSCIVVARPTKSTGLYQQMVGRGLRPDLSLPVAERGHALVLDVTGVSKRHDLASLVDLTERDPEKLRLEDLPELMSLGEMVDEIEAAEAAGTSLPDEFYTGPVEVTEFDPLMRQSDKVWIKTKGGTYFLPAGKVAYVFLVPSREVPNGWNVAWSTARHYERIGGKAGGWTEHLGLSLEMAMSWAEEVAVDLGGQEMGAMLAGKYRGWRKGRVSTKALALADNLGIPVPMKEDGVPAIKAGELSDLISTVMATKRIDPIIDVLMMTEDRP